MQVTAILCLLPGLLSQGVLLLLGYILLTPPLPYWTLGIGNVTHHHTACLGNVRLSHVWHTRRTSLRLIIPIWLHCERWCSDVVERAVCVLLPERKKCQVLWQVPGKLWRLCGIMYGSSVFYLSPLISIHLKNRKLVSDGSMYLNWFAVPIYPFPNFCT